MPAVQQTAAEKAAVASCDVAQIAALPSVPTTKLADDRRNACVVLPFHSGQGSGRLYLGKTRLTGNGVDTATVSSPRVRAIRS